MSGMRGPTKVMVTTYVLPGFRFMLVLMIRNSLAVSSLCELYNSCKPFCCFTDIAPDNKIHTWHTNSLALS